MKYLGVLGLGFLLLFPSVIFSQNKSLREGNELFDTGSFFLATESYERVLARKRADSMEVAHNIGYAYRKIAMPKEAVAWYRFLKANNDLTKKEHLYLAFLERQVENYAESDRLIKDYVQKYGAQDVSESLRNPGDIQKLRTDNGNFEIKLQNVSSPSSDISATFYSPTEVILSSSTRSPQSAKMIDSWRGNYLYDIYRAQLEENGDIKESWLRLDFDKNSFNGSAVVNHKIGALYFTRNNIKSTVERLGEDQDFLLRIYRIKFDKTGFDKAEDLSINDNSFSTAYPSVSKDGKRMYFSSNRPGGYGGMDIYYVDLDDDGLPTGKPVNLGPKVNTPQDDVFPHFNEDENLLFFSSEGHFGLGGLDIFVAKLDEEGKVSGIQNLGAPINSPYDDFSFFTNDIQTRGFFSSNRPGGRGGDDIYKVTQRFVIRNINCEGVIKDQFSGDPIAGATVYLKNNKGEIVDSTVSAENGTYLLMLSGIEDDFEIITKKDGFNEGSKVVKFSKEQSENYKTNVSVLPKKGYHFSGLITERESKNPVSGVTVVLFNNLEQEVFGKASTDGQGKFVSEELPYKYKDQVSFDIRFEKEGYVSKSVALATILDRNDEINVNQLFNLELTKIEVGKTDLNEVVDINPIYFDLNSSVIRDDAKVELNKVVAIMKENPKMVIELGAHTDSQGKADYNLWLSDKRAKSAANYITSQGIEKNRITGKGYGMTKLKIDDDKLNKASTPEEKEEIHQQNRRIEFIIVKMN